MLTPTPGQLILLALSVVLFAVGGGISIARLQRNTEALRLGAKICMYFGITAAVGVIMWHSLHRGDWVPINDNFETLIWLAVLLSLFVMYTQRARPLGGLDWFVMPIVILLLAAAGIFGTIHPQQYHGMVSDVWLWTHRVAAYGGAVAFAIAAAGGLMYVVAARRLRTKRPAPSVFGSLERIEHMTMASVTVGFALLSVGLVTGLVSMHQYRTSSAKLLMAGMAWVVYAVVLHIPFNPRWRGRRAAILSVFGFILMIGTLLAVMLISGGKR
jgi:ABC-type uncharacterized transport system permease subunit